MSKTSRYGMLLAGSCLLVIGCSYMREFIPTDWREVQEYLYTGEVLPGVQATTSGINITPHSVNVECELKMDNRSARSIRVREATLVTRDVSWKGELRGELGADGYAPLDSIASDQQAEVHAFWDTAPGDAYETIREPVSIELRVFDGVEERRVSIRFEEKLLFRFWR